MKYTLPVIFALAATSVAVPTAGGYGEGCNSFPGHRSNDNYGNNGGRNDFDEYRGRGDYDQYDGKKFGGKKSLIDLDLDINGHKKSKHFDGHGGKFGDRKGLINVDVDIKGHKNGHNGGHGNGRDNDFGGHRGGHFDGHDGRQGNWNGHNGDRNGHGGNWNSHGGKWNGDNNDNDWEHSHRKGGRFDADYYRGHGKGRSCIYPTFVNTDSLVVDVDVSVLGLADIDIDVDLDLSLNRVRSRYPSCKAFYCCPSRFGRGKHIGNNCYRHGN